MGIGWDLSEKHNPQISLYILCRYTFVGVQGATRQEVSKTGGVSMRWTSGCQDL